MEYVLVLQWSAGSSTDYDDLIALEDALEAALPEEHGYVDGHDFGSGEMNVFVFTEDPRAAFADAAAALGEHVRWHDVRVAYRPVDMDDHVIIWPEGLQEFSVT